MKYFFIALTILTIIPLAQANWGINILGKQSFYYPVEMTTIQNTYIGTDNLAKELGVMGKELAEIKEILRKNGGPGTAPDTAWFEKVKTKYDLATYGPMIGIDIDDGNSAEMIKLLGRDKFQQIIEDRIKFIKINAVLLPFTTSAFAGVKAKDLKKADEGQCQEELGDSIDTMFSKKGLYTLFDTYFRNPNLEPHQLFELAQNNMEEDDGLLKRKYKDQDQAVAHLIIRALQNTKKENPAFDFQKKTWTWASADQEMAPRLQEHARALNQEIRNLLEGKELSSGNEQCSKQIQENKEKFYTDYLAASCAKIPAEKDFHSCLDTENPEACIDKQIETQKAALEKAQKTETEFRNKLAQEGFIALRPDISPSTIFYDEKGKEVNHYYVQGLLNNKRAVFFADKNVKKFGDLESRTGVQASYNKNLLNLQAKVATAQAPINKLQDLKKMFSWVPKSVEILQQECVKQEYVLKDPLWSRITLFELEKAPGWEWRFRGWPNYFCAVGKKFNQWLKTSDVKLFVKDSEQKKCDHLQFCAQGQKFVLNHKPDNSELLALCTTPAQTTGEMKLEAETTDVLKKPRGSSTDKAPKDNRPSPGGRKAADGF
jgi:hypothetical protein